MPDAGLKSKRQNGQIWSHLRKRWLIETPEESVRQEYLCILVNEYGSSLDQMTEELSITGRGSGNARAGFVIWRSADDKRQNKSPLIVVECKSDNVTIVDKDYYQGDHYDFYYPTFETWIPTWAHPQSTVRFT